MSQNFHIEDYGKDINNSRINRDIILRTSLALSDGCGTPNISVLTHRSELDQANGGSVYPRILHFSSIEDPI